MQRYTVYLYLETALHVSGGTSTHHQKGIQLYLQHLVFVTSLLLSAAIVEKLEQVWVCCGWRTLPTAIFTTLNQQIGQICSLDIYNYNKTRNIAPCFDPEGNIIRDSNKSKAT
jgi:hypothetical protein